MTWDLGYLVGTAIFLSALVVLVAIQIAAKKFHPFLYWSTIVASTTAGTTMADFATRSSGIGRDGQHAKGRSVLLGGDYVFPNLRPPSATGLPTHQASATEAERSYSAPDWQCSLRPISGRMCRESCCSGPRLS